MNKRQPVQSLKKYVSDLPRRKKLAIAVDKTPDYLYQIAEGYVRCGAPLALAINRETGGAVRLSELRGDIWGRK